MAVREVFETFHVLFREEVIEDLPGELQPNAELSARHEDATIDISRHGSKTDRNSSR